MQEVGEVREVEDVDRERSEKGRRLARWDHPAVAGSQLGGEGAVGDAGVPADVDQRLGHLGGQDLVATEVARRSPRGDGAHARAHHLEGVVDHRFQFHPAHLDGELARVDARDVQ